ncbi:hypothetical protein D9M72_637250 [compost metagenome]
MQNGGIGVPVDEGSGPAVEHVGAHGDADRHVMADIKMPAPMGEPPHGVGGKVVVQQ